MEIRGADNINGEIAIPGDKSISHRSAIISSLSDKTVSIKNYLFSSDCMATLDVLKKLGVTITISGKDLTITGCGISGLREPTEVLEVGNSGTAIRLLSGVLAGNPIMSVLSGDSSINSRPMARIIEPLKQMGSKVYGRNNDNNAPLVIFGNKRLKGKNFILKLSSAQVKSCILLAALHAEGITEIIQPEVSRDHTERMLEYFGADIQYDGKYTKINPLKKVIAKDITVPSDISSALFFIVAALILKDSHIILKNIGMNPTRSHALDILKAMGGKIDIKNKRNACNEPVADIEVYSSSLESSVIEKDKIPNIIDEIPILSVAAAVASGKTVFRGAQELRNKESDRLKAVSEQFGKAGVQIKELEDGLEISGRHDLKVNGCKVDSMGDHRIAMSLAILSLLTEQKVTILNTACIDTSFPGFKDIFNSIWNNR
jgi:3-phosphoshikimate 1-carboxyvinyltransferase